jgi:hypothetical protein
VTRRRSVVLRQRVATSPAVTWARLLQHVWRGGAGFGPRPVIEAPGDAHGVGCTRRIGGWLGVREQIVAGDCPRSLTYRVLNPSWWTYPVEEHRGSVRFAPLAGGGCEVEWRVTVLPKPGAGLLVMALTRFVIARYLAVLLRVCGPATPVGSPR